jgi:hypothetical protein
LLKFRSDILTGETCSRGTKYAKYKKKKEEEEAEKNKSFQNKISKT